ncbi:hypothetical protein FRC17_005625 [Serendipita sp. 399]|nr:hypothetical protein FRC17_005625 [Serendipita sp. 399]
MSSSQSPPTGPLFEQYQTPGTGIGYRSYAAQIVKGTLLFEEEPLFTLPANHTAAHVQQLVQTLDQATHTAFFSLHIPHQFLDNGPYQGRFLANALPCTTQAGRAAGLFLRGARFNHSCRPNVQYKWDRHSRKMRFYAIKTIGYMEELCISYDEGSILLARVPRKQRLLERVGFQCNCTACIAPNVDSDNRRIYLKDVVESIEGTVGSSVSDPREYLFRNTAITNALNALYHEGICRYRDTLYYAGFKNARMAGDGNNAMLWLNLAYTAVAVAGGTHSELGRELAQLRNTLTAQQIGNRLILPNGPPICPD